MRFPGIAPLSIIKLLASEIKSGILPEIVVSIPLWGGIWYCLTNQDSENPRRGRRGPLRPHRRARQHNRGQNKTKNMAQPRISGAARRQRPAERRANRKGAENACRLIIADWLQNAEGFPNQEVTLAL